MANRTSVRGSHTARLGFGSSGVCEPEVKDDVFIKKIKKYKNMFYGIVR